MRVLFLAHSFPRYQGDSAGVFILRLATALRDYEGVEVHVLAPAAAGFPAREEIEGISVERFRYAPHKLETLAYTGTLAADVGRSWGARLALGGMLAAQLAAARAARRRFRPDLIHAHWWFPAGVVGAAAAGLPPLPLVTTSHGSDVRLGRSVRVAIPPLRWVLRRSAAFTTVSRWLADEIRAIVPDAAPIVAPMPVDTAAFTPGGERSSGRLLFVGRLNEQKGIAELVAAMRDLPRQIALDVVGDGPLRDALLRTAAEQGSTDRIRWLGALPAGELPPLYRQAAAVVVPSVDEGLGLVAAEALLCGTPVVAADSGGLRDVVQDGVTGILVPPSDAAALAAGISRLLALPDRGESLASAGRQHALALFSPESVARRYADIYRSALGTRAT